MKDVIEINNRLRVLLGGSFSNGAMLLRRKDESDELKNLPAKLQEDIAKLRDSINHAMPDDFNYTLSLGEEHPDLMIDYADGPQVEFFRQHSWEPGRSVAEQLKEFDWDAERQLALSWCRQHDEMLAEAKKAPSRLPPTKGIQKTFRDEMKDFVKTKRKDATRVHVLMWRDDEGMREWTCESLEALVWELVDLMPAHYLVITVVAEGKPLPIEKIDSLKHRALKELEQMPTSHAKALWKL
jgi:hypothetical protein